MSSTEEAREAWKVWDQEHGTDVDFDVMNDGIALAGEYIAALEAENRELRDRRLPCREAEVAQKRYEEAEAAAGAFGTALATLTHHAQEFTDGQSVKTRQRLGMAMTYASAVLRADPDPMKAVHAHWDAHDGFLVTHFDLIECEQFNDVDAAHKAGRDGEAG